MSKEYNKTVELKKFKVIKPFLHFEKGDEVTAVVRFSLKLPHSYNSTYADVSIEIEGRSYDTVLPPKALYDEDFFKGVWEPKKLESFLTEMNLREDFLAQALHNKAYSHKGLLKVVEFLRELWYHQSKSNFAYYNFKNKKDM